MTAFFVAEVKVKNGEKAQEYVSKVGATIAAFGGKPIIRGKAEKVLAGNSDGQMVAVFSFPDMDAIQNWYDSADYQALIPIREEGLDATIVAYEAMD